MNNRDKRKLSAARRRAEQHGMTDLTSIRIPDGMSLLKIKEGTMRLDILGYTVGEGNPWADKGTFYFERTFWVHRGIGPNQGSYVCPAKTARKPCPICDHIKKLAASNNDESLELAKSLAPKERQLFNVYNPAEPEKGIQLLEISFFNFGKRLDSEIRAAEDDENIDLFYAHTKKEGGMSVKVNWVEANFAGVTYLTADSVKFVPRIKDIDEDILQNIACLDDLLIIHSYDDLKKIYMQLDEEDEDSDSYNKEEEEQEEEPVAHKHKHIDTDNDEVPFNGKDIPYEEVEEVEEVKPKKQSYKSVLDELDEEEVDDSTEEGEKEKLEEGDVVEFSIGDEVVTGTVLMITNDDKAKVKTDSGKIKIVEVNKLTLSKS